MVSLNLLIALSLVLQAKATAPPIPETAADALTLRDGSIVLGQVVEAAPRGVFLYYVRRAWAEAKLPEQAKRWDASAAVDLKRAYEARGARLAAWKRERVKSAAGQDDPIGRWLDQELERFQTQPRPPPAPVMVVAVPRPEIKGIVRRPKASARMLRQAWLAGFRDAETMKLADLNEALAGRGFAADVKSGTPVVINRLLPILPENDDQWLARRAATEATNDTGVRFSQFQDLLLPESLPGQLLTADMAKGMVAGLAPLLGDKPADPLAAQLKEVAARGRVGAVVTRLDISPAFDAVQVTMTLLVRNGERWSKAGSKTATARADHLGPGGANDLAQDPQILAVFKVFESIGFGLPADVKQQSVNIGGATRKALGTARGAFSERLAAMALSIEGAGDEKARD